MVIGRRSTYFPSPPESAEPPITPETIPPDPEPHHTEETQEPKQKEPKMPPRETGSYEWPLDSSSGGHNLKASKVYNMKYLL